MPFTILTSGGRDFPVPHPEFIFVTKRFVIVADAEGYTTTLDPLHITGVRDSSQLPSD